MSVPSTWTQEAVTLAENYGAEVELVHAVVAAEPASKDPFDVHPEFFVTAATEEITALQQKAGTHLKVHVGAGSVRDVVRDAAMKFAADLVIIGRGPHPEAFQSGCGAMRIRSLKILLVLF